MTKETELEAIVKRELGNRGYVVTASTRREGEYIIGRVAVTSAETGESVTRIVGVGNVDNLHLCFGVDAEGTVRDVVTKALGSMDGLKGLIPSFIITPPKR